MIRPRPVGVRALLVGALAPALGAAAHLEAGGGFPTTTPGLVATAVVVAGLAAALTHAAAGPARREPGVLAVAAVLGLGQAVWHAALAVAPAGAGSGHAMTGGPAAPMTAMSAMAPTPTMVAAHALATVVVALGVVGADRALLVALAARLRRVLVVLCAPRPAAARSSGPVIVRPDGPWRRRVIVRCAPRRGPPVLSP